MEIVPLQDTLPPRYAIESDDSEDEGDAILKRSVPKPEPKIVLDWRGPQPKRQSLLIALNQAGKCWAEGVGLEEAKGRVCVNDVEVASAFCPSWAEVTIILVYARLPLYAMHTFASIVINAILPATAVIIDSYPIPTYISSSPPPLPPIRYLRSSAASQNPPPINVEPFHPPNLIQSSAASFLAMSESRMNSILATLLLLPSRHIPPPAPSDIGSRSGPLVQEGWETSTIIKLHDTINALIGSSIQWSVKHNPGRSSGVKHSQRGDIGEGGIYI